MDRFLGIECARVHVAMFLHEVEKNLLSYQSCLTVLRYTLFLVSEISTDLQYPKTCPRQKEEFDELKKK